jgi:hypothetical protein
VALIAVMQVLQLVMAAGIIARLGDWTGYASQ